MEVEPAKGHFEAFRQENPAATQIQPETDKEVLFRQFQAWGAGRTVPSLSGSQMGSKKVRDQEEARDRDHASRSARQANHSRHLPSPSHRVKPARANLPEQGAASHCEQQGYSRDVLSRRRASEQVWRPFPGATPPPATQGISSTDDPLAALGLSLDNEGPERELNSSAAAMAPALVTFHQDTSCTHPEPALHGLT